MALNSGYLNGIWGEGSCGDRGIHARVMIGSLRCTILALQALSPNVLNPATHLKISWKTSAKTSTPLIHLGP